MRFKRFIMIFAAMALAAVLVYAFRGRIIERLYPKEYANLVEQYAAQYELPPALIYAVIRTESHFDPQALSSVGARGLTQIMPETFDWLMSKTGEQLPHDALYEPEYSIRYGALLLHMLLDEFGQTETALAAYHAGRGQVNRWLKDPDISADGKRLAQIPFPDTRHYVSKVMDAYEKYQ